MARPIRELLSMMTEERLGHVALAFNNLQAFGVRVSVAHGAILTDYGFLLQDEDGTWGVRMKITDPDMIPRGDPDDD